MPREKLIIHEFCKLHEFVKYKLKISKRLDDKARHFELLRLKST